jgi:hypothetical protein
MNVQARIKVFYFLCNKWQTKTHPVPSPHPPHFFIDFILRVFYLDTLECVSIGGSEHAVLSA